MANLSILAGATSQSILLKLLTTTGTPQTGLVFNSVGLTAYYSFTGANATATAITLATLAAVNSAYSSGGFKEIDATNMPGIYRFDVPNAALATAKGRQVTICFNGFAGLAPDFEEIELTGWDNQLVPGAAGGMFIAGTNAATAITSTVSGTAGLTITGNGAGNGLYAIGGATGAGVQFDGGATSGNGMFIRNQAGSGAGNAALRIVANGSTDGVNIVGGLGSGSIAAGNGIKITAGSSGTTGGAGAGILITGGAAATGAGGVAGVGVAIIGGAGAASTNGAASGATITGGGTNTVVSVADGLKLTGTSNGSGLDCVLAGTGASITATTIAGAITSITNPVTVGTINSTATNIKKNVALNNFEFLMTDSTNHLPKTGLSITATRSLDGGAFGACANAVSEIASGIYSINLATTDMNANTITLRFTSTGADDSLITIVTQP